MPRGDAEFRKLSPSGLSPDEREWLAECFAGISVDLVSQRPSDWAESRRYLPASVTPMPGYYRFDVTPYLREILDCLDVESPIREVAVQKGAQIGFTAGVLENAIGYFIDHVKTAPLMLVTAEAELAQLRMDSYVTPMLQHSGLQHLIKSSDETNTRKTGKTDKKLEWEGGGSLLPFGARNANKMRSFSILGLLNDEVDGWPDLVGADGDPVKLCRARTSAYESRRKILDGSTPKIKGQSKIVELFKKGDQRYYFVNCLSCGHPQVLRWQRIEGSTGVITGITWDMDGALLVPGSVRYLCEKCSHPHTEADKRRLFAEGRWQPTATAVDPTIRSYHLSALYSPPGMQSWEMCVRQWLDAWDPEKARPKDLGALQVFYNNILGEPFELRGEQLRFENVSSHRRPTYQSGRIPNRFAAEFCGSPVLVLTCAVDVHKDVLKVAVWGWCRERRAVLIEYIDIEGSTDNVDAGAWSQLRDVIESREYVADDGKKYRIEITLIDSGYLTDHVYRFCGDYDGGVFPVKGQAFSPKSTKIPEWSSFVTPNGVRAYGITVDLYKDRWSAALRRHWDGITLQPAGHFNAPSDLSDRQLKELTVEVKREKIEKTTGKRVGFEWHRPNGAANELWDLLIYGNCALDLLAWDMSQRSELEFTNWPAFWDECEFNHAFFKPS